ELARGRAAEQARKERAEALANARRELERLKQAGSLQATVALLEDLRRRFPEESEFAQEYDRAAAELARGRAAEPARKERAEALGLRNWLAGGRPSRPARNERRC